MIDLHKERKFVYKLLDRAKMPYPLREEKFQDFAAYFYENYKYDDTYTESTYIGLLFGNWLTLCAIEYKKKYKILNHLTTNTDGGGSLNGSDGRLARGVAKNEGVTRQAIEQRIQKDLKKVLENL